MDDFRTALRARVAGYRAAAALGADWRPGSPADAFDAALDLIAFAGATLDAPDPTRDREDAATRAAWARLRKRLAR